MKIVALAALVTAAFLVLDGAAAEAGKGSNDMNEAIGFRPQADPGTAPPFDTADFRKYTVSMNGNASASGQIVVRFLEKRSGDEERNAALSEGYGLSGLAQAAPRDQGQPTAVQVRISNPDKL